jgi:FMN phosphatase YigB (HAD superfamily)
MEVAMVKKISRILSCLTFLFCLCVSPLFSYPDKQVVVAWDIHGVLCSEPDGRGYNCVPNPETFELVKKLHKKGVKQVLFSNISESSRRKLLERYPEFFQYFDLSKSMANGEGIFTRKPHGKYVEKFLERVWPMNATNIVFFDDKEKNVNAAREYCIDAHVFSGAAHATEILRQRNLI